MKVCFKCKIEKPLSDYYRHSDMSDGYLNKCKSCTKKDAQDYRYKNIDAIREYDRDRGNRQDYSYTKEYRLKFPKKIKAQSKVSREIKKGNLSRKPCEICGEIKSVAHHDDYDKPLDVRWLCQAHHKQWHAVNGGGLNQN